MTKPVVIANGLGKRYRLGELRQERTLREAIMHGARAPFRRLGRRSRAVRTGPNEVWALKDATFTVAPGEVLGIIGRNGAGKSTLLKILSRITEPTVGEAEIRGVVASLLEVGTGFHPELTGRENIFLNGVLLGMRHQDVARKFDQIVAFAETAKFIDTPVKHYSSGMHVRLAFAVAAHLDPEVLIVDEVLAVGDAEFQRRCLGKMSEVVREGRTVLFVSHNMGAVASLCSRALLLQDGRIVANGGPDDIIGQYLRASERNSGVSLRDRKDREGNGRMKFTEFRILGPDGESIDHVMSGQPCTFELSYESHGVEDPVNVLFQIWVSTLFGQPLFTCHQRSASGSFSYVPRSGRVRCTIPRLPLGPGAYLLALMCKVDEAMADKIPAFVELSVLASDFYGTGRLPPAPESPFLVAHSWELADTR